MADTSLTRRPATELARMVHEGTATASAVMDAHLELLARDGDRFGAFQYLRPEEARADARRLDALGERDRRLLPLAGVPVAVKDNVAVGGLPMRVGSAATSERPSAVDHPVVARLRAAGAIVLGTTRMPELGLWGTSDNESGTARSPWNPTRTAGGSSGGSAAAVAAGLVPVAHGNDGLGSVRIPAACCGLVGIKPGAGVVPARIGLTDWFGIAENGALGTTVPDVALMLSVLAADPRLAIVEAPRRQRIALAVAAPVAGFPVERELATRTREIGELLAAAGHDVEEVAPPSVGPRAALAMTGTWAAGAREEVEALTAADPDAWGRLEPRTRRHAQAGAIARRLGLAQERHRIRWRRTFDRFFERHDLLLTPTLARSPLPADGWRRRSWAANLVANLLFVPHCGPVNFARLPAIAVPAGLCSDGMPASAHLVGRGGSESLLLGMAALIETGRPWMRHPPAGG